MTEARHVFDFDRGEYERPNQQWTCGRASEGLTCALGPSGSGHCGAVCEPYLDGDRYYCNNVSMLSNGCDVGPLENGSCCQIPAECQPARVGGGGRGSPARSRRRGPPPPSGEPINFAVC